MRADLCMHTNTPHGTVVQFKIAVFLPLSSILQVCTLSHSNKSVYLRADTKVTQLDLSSGVHQHIGRLDICGDKLLDRTATSAICCLPFINSAVFFFSFFLNNTATLLTSVKYLQAPQICQTFDNLDAGNRNKKKN